MTAAIRREMKRRTAIEPVIGPVKAEHRMDLNHLKGREGDRANAVLAAAGYNFSLLLRWLEWFLRAPIAALFAPSDTARSAWNNATRLLHLRPRSRSIRTTPPEFFHGPLLSRGPI